MAHAAGDVDYEQAFIRVGLFLGGKYEPEMSRWMKKMVRIV